MKRKLKTIYTTQYIFKETFKYDYIKYNNLIVFNEMPFVQLHIMMILTDNLVSRLAEMKTGPPAKGSQKSDKGAGEKGDEKPPAEKKGFSSLFKRGPS